MNIKNMKLEGDVFCKSVAEQAVALRGVEIVSSRWHNDGMRVIVSVWKQDSLSVLWERFRGAEYIVSVHDDEVAVHFAGWTDEEVCYS